MSLRPERTGFSLEPGLPDSSGMTSYRLAVLGDPISHSRSPVIQTALLELSGLEGEYTAVRADEKVLAEAVDGMRRGVWDGLNVTMPLKGAAARLADRLSPLAELGGSVNTLVREDSSIVGHSTDATTFEDLFDSERFSSATSVLILGAGGSAAAALSAIRHRNVFVTARRPEGADLITGRLGGTSLDWITPVPGAVVVNTTPIGMHGETLPVGILEHAAGLIDLPYGDETTPAVRSAHHLGLPVVDGHEFLLRQAMGSFKLWTGRDVGLVDLIARLRKT